jgi:1-acyl-sn-glycerol-3-phosphate acyltransferase
MSPPKESSFPGFTSSAAVTGLRLVGRASRYARRVRSLPPPWTAPDWPATVDREPPERELGVDYDTAWARRYPVRLARALVVDNVTRPLAHAVASPSVRGEEILSFVEPPMILVANHTSHVDTALLVSVLPPKLRHHTIVAGAADYFFDRTWKAHMWAFLTAAIPIERQRVNRRSADLSASLIEEGWNLLIYPEGGRSPDGWMQDFKPGAAYLAVRTRRPVVPVHLDGTWKVMARKTGSIHRSPTTVTFGSPLRPRDGEDTRSFGKRIEQAIHLLAAERTTDWWTARTQLARGEISGAHGPAGSTWRRAWALTACSGHGRRDENWALRR